MVFTHITRTRLPVPWYRHAIHIEVDNTPELITGTFYVVCNENETRHEPQGDDDRCNQCEHWPVRYKGAPFAQCIVHTLVNHAYGTDIPNPQRGARLGSHIGFWSLLHVSCARAVLVTLRVAGARYTDTSAAM